MSSTEEKTFMAITIVSEWFTTQLCPILKNLLLDTLICFPPNQYF